MEDRPLTTLQLYRAACEEAKSAMNETIVAAIRASDKTSSLALRGKGSLQSQLPDIILLDQDIAPLTAALQKNTTITTLNLSYNRITDAGCVALAGLIENTKTLRSLNLAFNDFGSAGAVALASAFQLNHSVVSLNLRGNKFASRGGLQLAAMLQINDTLQDLDVGDTDLDVSALIAFMTILNYNRCIKSLNVDRPLLKSTQDEVATHIARMLKVNVGLERLSVRKCGITDSGAKIIAEHMMHNHSLRLLNLGSNSIARDGAIALAGMLEGNSQLQGLDLHSNRIEDPGAAAIAHIIKSKRNTALKFLGTANNNIGPEGIIAISQALAVGTIVSFEIWGNPGVCGASLSHAACKAIRDVLGSLDADVKSYVVDGKTLLAQVER